MPARTRSSATSSPSASSACRGSSRSSRAVLLLRRAARVARRDPRTAELVAGASAALRHDLAPYAVWADTAAVIVALGDRAVVSGGEAVELAPAASVDGARRLFGLGFHAPLPGVRADEVTE